MMKKLLISTLMMGMAMSVQARSLLDGDYVIERAVAGSQSVLPSDDKVALNIAGNKVSGFSGCNRFMGEVTYRDGTIKMGPLAGTRRACLNADANRTEQTVLAALGAASRFALDQTNGAVVLRGLAGELVTLKRAPEVETWEIAPDTKPCSAGAGRMDCLQVRKPGAQAWQFHYFGIDGLTKEAGVGYVVKVRQERIDNPPADAPDRRWVLVEVLETKR
ncbi:DUF4377 domain-containing protein [Chitinibacteraceae bacterium HSL-7]